MKTLTNAKLESMRKEIDAWADKWNLPTDLYSIFMLGKKYENGVAVEEVSPWDYCEGYNADFIFGMSIDGDVYDCLHVTENYWDDACFEFMRILEKYGLAMDFVDSTHLTTYLLDDDTEVEFRYGKSVPIDVEARFVDTSLRNIVHTWWEEARKVGDKGMTMTGAYVSFIYNGLRYEATAPSCYPGKDSWEKPLPLIKRLLSEVGATDIEYHYGVTA